MLCLNSLERLSFDGRSLLWGRSLLGAIAFLVMEKIDRPLPKQKKPGFLDNLCLSTDILMQKPGF
ncbi:hypothetical protein QUA46_05400 [Microcoleus sp. MON2_D6]|uniref:hypothetical protein n=1 Tax=unclassified Microcoleus TaxID=2642155 RepID=UPI002FD22C9E